MLLYGTWSPGLNKIHQRGTWPGSALIWTAKHPWLPSHLGVFNSTAHSVMLGISKGLCGGTTLYPTPRDRGNRSPFLLSGNFHWVFSHQNANKFCFFGFFYFKSPYPLLPNKEKNIRTYSVKDLAAFQSCPPHLDAKLPWMLKGCGCPITLK